MRPFGVLTDIDIFAMINAKLKSFKLKNMNKILRIIGSILSATAAIIMVVFLVQSFLPESSINRELTDSLIDKIFFAFMIMGCAGFYAILSVGLLKGFNLMKNIVTQKWAIISCFIFLSGIYYSVMFGSPW